MFSFKKEYIKNIDWYMLILMCILIGIGLVAISSATAYNGDTSIVASQFRNALLGFVIMFIAMCIDYHLLGEWYIGIYIITNIVLISVFFIGKDAGGATRWIEIGGMQIQPSEFAKITVILCTAKLIAKYNERINSVVPLGIIALFQFVPFILINRQPNLSTSIVIVLILVVQLFVSKLDMRYIISIAIIGLAAVILFLGYIVSNPNQTLVKEYQRQRIVTKIQGGDSLGSDYQTSRSIHAIGSGGASGKGLYQGAISQLNYLPESHNDFIVATIAEEFGFVGIVFTIIIILLFVARGFWIAHGASDEFGKFIVVGYMGMIAIQSFVNMGVANGLLPNTGLPLPFISYGGSSLWANMMGLGLVLNVGMRKEQTMF